MLSPPMWVCVPNDPGPTLVRKVAPTAGERTHKPEVGPKESRRLDPHDGL
jgi:hypothetical protein